MIIKSRIWITLPLVAVLLFLALQSVNRGISSIFYINFRYFISPPVVEERLKDAESLLAAANSFSAANPWYYMLKGSVKILQARQQEVETNKKDLLSEASGSYFQALLLQADNPFAWLGLVQTNSEQDNKNHLEYLERAVKYGPSNQMVLLNYFYFALIHWDKMDKKEQRVNIGLLEQTILAKDFSLHYSGSQMNEILVEYKLKSEFCNNMKTEPKINAFCNNKYQK